ncbi:MAG: flagellar assembly protein FliW [Deltaproteobacteria bacterium]|nr:flagellar assembly protein FliW [Deltaproteobacteria bacterium]
MSELHNNAPDPTPAPPAPRVRFHTSRFGDIDVEIGRAIKIPGGLLGFPDSARYALLEPDQDSPFWWLQSLDEGDLAFVVTDPMTFFPEYQVDARAEELEARGIVDREDLDVLVILSLRGSIESMTANLQGPILLNSKTRVGRQFVLKDSGYQTRHPLFPEFDEPIAEPAE